MSPSLDILGDGKGIFTLLLTHDHPRMVDHHEGSCGDLDRRINYPDVVRAEHDAISSATGGRIKGLRSREQRHPDGVTKVCDTYMPYLNFYVTRNNLSRQLAIQPSADNLLFEHRFRQSQCRIRCL